jgi:hypothetical protein
MSYELFDPERIREKILNLLDVLSPADVEAWVKHPCTESLLLGLTLDEAVALDNWTLGNYTSEHAEGTAQLNAQALGNVEAIRKIKRFILEEMIPDDNHERT